MVILFEGDLNVGVIVADGAAGHALGVGDAVGEADVVEDVVEFGGRDLFANGVFDEVAELCHVLDAQPAVATDVEDELAAVGRGEEVLAEERQQQKGGENHDEEDGNEDRAVEDEFVEHDVVLAAHALELAFEAALETAEEAYGWIVTVFLSLEQVHRQRGDQRERVDIGGDHGEYDGFRKRHEEITGDAGEEEHRQKNDADAERGDQGGNRDLGGALEDGMAQGLALFQIALNVFDGDGGVVDEDADGKREAAEGHGVDGLAKHAEHDDRGEDGKWDGDSNDDGRAPTAEEQQDHERRERGGDDAFADHAFNRGAHKDGLVGQRREPDALRDGGEDLRKQRTHALDHVQRGCRAVLEHADEHAAAAILPHDVGLHAEAIRDAGDVVEIYGCSVNLLEGNVAEVGDGARRAVGAHVVLGGADFDGARGGDDVLLRQRGQQIAGRDALGLHGGLIHVDENLALFAAVRQRYNGAGNADQLRADKVGGGIVKGLLRHALAGDTNLQDGYAGCREVEDLRRQDAGRELAQQKLRGCGNLRVGGVEAGAGLEENLDHDFAVVGGRLNVLNVIDQCGQSLLVGRGQPALKLLGIQAGIGPADRDHGDVDVGEDVGGGAKDDDRAQQQDQQGKNNEGVGAVQRQFDYPHCCVPSLCLSP